MPVISFQRGASVNEKRRDNKGRVLRNSESQRPDGKYEFSIQTQRVFAEVRIAGSSYRPISCHLARDSVSRSTVRPKDILRA